MLAGILYEMKTCTYVLESRYLPMLLYLALNFACTLDLSISAYLLYGFSLGVRFFWKCSFCQRR